MGEGRTWLAIALTAVISSVLTASIMLMRETSGRTQASNTPATSTVDLAPLVASLGELVEELRRRPLESATPSRERAERRVPASESSEQQPVLPDGVLEREIALLRQAIADAVKRSRGGASGSEPSRSADFASINPWLVDARALAAIGGEDSLESEALVDRIAETEGRLKGKYLGETVDVLVSDFGRPTSIYPRKSGIQDWTWKERDPGVGIYVTVAERVITGMSIR